MDISKFINPEIIFGQETLSQVGDSLVRLGARKVFLVTDPGIIEAGWIDTALPFIEQNGLEVEVWSRVTPNPKDHEVEAAVRRYHKTGCDAVLAIGGGSPIDCAKAVALLSTNDDGGIEHYEGIDKITHPLPPMVMVPSTAGTGADVSQFCIVTDSERRVKMVIASKSLVPDISITDPLLLTTKDRELTAHTGMDALTHAIEAYLSVAATVLTDVHALNALRLIAGNLRESIASQTNLPAKNAMAMASLQAGLAFSNAVLGATHAMAHQVGGLLDLAHGQIEAILLPHVMEFNFIAATERYIDIARALGQPVDGLSRREAGRQAIVAVKVLAADVGVPQTLAEIGIEPDIFPQLSVNAMQDICLVTNPRDITVADIEAIYRRAWQGDAVDD